MLKKNFVYFCIFLLYIDNKFSIINITYFPLYFIYRKERHIINNSYEQILSLINDIDAGIIKCDVSPSITVNLVNNGFFQIIGYTQEQFSSECENSLAHIIHHDDIFDIVQTLDFQRTHLDSMSIEARIVCRDKSIVWVLIKSKISQNYFGDLESTMVLTDITDMKNMEISLKINEKMFSFAIDQSNIIILKYDPISDTMYNAKKIMPNFPTPDLIKNFTKEILSHGYVYIDDIQAFISLFKSVQNGNIFSQGVFRWYNSDDNLLWYDVKIATILDNKGNPVQCVVAMEDVTEIRKLSNENEFHKSMISDSSLAYEANITKNLITYVDPIIAETHPNENIITFTDLVAHLIKNYIHEDFTDIFANFCSKETIQNILWSNKYQNSIEYYRMNFEDKKYHWYKNTMNIVYDKNNDDLKIRCYLKNIDNQKLHELDLKYKSERDLLSGMYNKITTEEKIREYITLCQTTGKQCALFLIDIDKFKQINDRFGHALGDVVISKASKKIMDSFRDNDIIGRVGGDEFIILMRNISSTENAKMRANLLCNSLHDTYTLDSTDDLISVSIGVALYPENGSNYEDLYKNADRALYASKAKGRNCYTVYSDCIDT